MPKKKLVALWLAVAAVALPADEGKRIALIIGNDAYTVKPLRNAVNDARAVDKALRAAGFRTIVRENADKIAMERAAAEFFKEIGPSDTALFFYAGHAVQIESENVLIPTDFESSWTPLDARFRSFSLGVIFDSLKRYRAKMGVVIVDACRNSPIADSNSLQAGLAVPMNANKETYIAFSTSPNHVATDNPDGNNSWFTEALADLISQEGLPLDEVFTRVRMRVEKATNGAQTPWSQTSLTTKFFFHPPKNLEAAIEPDLAERLLQDALRKEQRGDWDDSVEVLNRVLKLKPGGTIEEIAKLRLPFVTARQKAAADSEAGRFASAAANYEEALGLDPFAFDAAAGAVTSYLLTEDFLKALPPLRAMRQRGSSTIAAKAEAILAQLAPASTEAAQELKLGIPQPPPVQELFPARRFSVPDFSAGERFLRQTPSVELAAWLRQIPERKPVSRAVESPGGQPGVAVEAPPAPQASPSAEDTAALAAFHVDVKTLAASRDLVPEEFGELELKSSQSSMPVVLDGRAVAQQLPYRVKVPSGKYIIRTVDRGRVITTQEVEVQPGRLAPVALK